MYHHFAGVGHDRSRWLDDPIPVGRACPIPIFNSIVCSSRGAPLGASVGVVTGLILSLANISAFSQMSLLAFSGMLAGMLKEGKKGGVSLGMPPGLPFSPSISAILEK